MKKLHLFAERQRFPNKTLGAKDFRGKPYRERYEFAFKEFAYDFRLNDQSLLLFKKAGEDIHNGSLNFSHLEAPTSVMSYELFVGSLEGLSPGEPDYDKALEAWGDALRPDYEVYVQSLDLKSAVTPLRYDCQAADYRAGLHPASHMHFGFESQIRVGTRRVVTPLGFVLFVVRQRYPTEWSQLLRWENCAQLCRNVRVELNEVDERYWCDGDEQELFLA